MEGHTCNPSTSEAEVRGLWVPGQPELHSETLSKCTSPQKKVWGKFLLKFISNFIKYIHLLILNGPQPNYCF
jgi:hypothetical protein